VTVLTGHAHLDLAWVWTRSEAREEAVSSARAAADLLERHPAACFAMSQAAAYRWIGDDDPLLLDRIRELVHEGRWEPVGGWWVEPDLFGASPDSIRRQALVGQSAFEEFVGRRCTVGFCPDTFGHPAWLPDVLWEAGLDSYVITRPGDHEAGLAPAFWWDGPRGGRVKVLRPEVYAGPPHADPSGLCLYGVGNHGGGPTAAHVEEADRLVESGRARHGTIADAVRSVGEALPVVRGDLVHHARGCYATLISFKERLQRLETALLQRDAPPSSWTPLLFWQFHDVLAGTAIPEVYEEAAADLWRLERSLALPTPPATDAPTFVPRQRVDEGRPVVVRETIGERWDGWVPAIWSSTQPAASVEAEGAPAVLRRVDQHGLGYRLHVLLWLALRPYEERMLSWRVIPGPPPAPPPPPAGVRLAVLVDGTDTWGHSLRSYGLETRSSPGTRLVLAGGPNGLVEVWGDWHEKDRVLKLVVPADFSDTEGEMPGGQWNGPVVWGRVWSYDVVAGDLRITLRRSPPFALHDPMPRQLGVEYRYQEQGSFSARLWFQPRPARVPPVVATV